MRYIINLLFSPIFPSSPHHISVCPPLWPLIDQIDDLEVPKDCTGIIDMEVFNQIREMDDDEDDEEGGGHEFSKGIVWGYFEQAEATFIQMQEAM